MLAYSHVVYMEDAVFNLTKHVDTVLKATSVGDSSISCFCLLYQALDMYGL